MTISQDKQVSEGENLLGVLFGSETRAKILKLLVLSSPTAFRLSDLAKQTGMDISGVHRELSNLVALKIITSDSEYKNPEYKINANHLIFHGLLEIFKKTESLVKKYFIFEEMPVGYPQIGSDYLNVGITNNYLRSISLNSKLSKTLAVYEYPKLNIYFSNDEFKAISKEIILKLVDDPQWALNDVQEVIRTSTDLLNLADEIEKQNYASCSMPEILKLLKKYALAYEKAHVRGWIGNASDMPDMLFTKHLLFLLQEKIRKKGSLINSKNAFSKLTTPREESFMQKEYEDLLKLLVEISEDKKQKEMFRDLEPRHVISKIKGTAIGKKIEKHTHDYGWISYGFIGPNWDESYFIGILSSLIRQNTDPQNGLEEIRKNKEELVREQDKIIKSLDLDKNEQDLFEVARGFVFTKGYRKDAMFKFCSRVELFYREVSRRLHLSITDIRFCFPHEFDRLVSGEEALIKTLMERQKFSICESTGSYSEDLYLNGDEAKKYLEKLPFEKEESTQVSMLTGTCACPGRVRGKVRIINTPKEMDKMEKGDILVSIATSPDLVVAMKKAAAIVTDMGGITSHAAIVSRELNIPCVVGTRIATKALEDNMLVDVDATHGTVKIVELDNKK